MAQVKDICVCEEPSVSRFLFGDTRLAWLWLPLRLYLGYTWLESGWEKFLNPRWMETGAAVQGFWANAVRLDPRPVIAFDWYRAFIQMLLDTGSYTWFARLIVFGELAVGLALIIGAFTGLAAFFGAFMNWNFVMAGTASTNALLFVIAIWLLLAWRTAGWIGLDRWILPALGTTWGVRVIYHPAHHHEIEPASASQQPPEPAHRH